MMSHTLKVHRVVLSAVLALTLSGAALVAPVFADDAAPVTNPNNGKAIYDASFKNLKDQDEKLSAFKGKVTVVYFWATWCVPCRIETPKLVKLYGDYKAKGVEVVGIALDNGDKVRAFTKEKGVTYPIFYGGHDAVELGKTLGNDIGGVPFLVVIDKTGKIVATFQGDLPDGKLESVINLLIG